MVPAASVPEPVEHGSGSAAASRPADESWWSASRAQIKSDEKTLMAQYFVRHHFLVREGHNPESNRETVASIVANQGTTPSRVVEECLKWIEQNHAKQGPFFLTWYTPGHVIPDSLRSFRDRCWPMRTAARLFLFPGEVDDETESVFGPDAENFTENLKRHFTYAFLSAYSFDICNGGVYFHVPREVRLQKACAKLFAAHKFLFVDSSKLKSEGEMGYNLHDLLETAATVTIYTVSCDKDDWVESKFRQICKKILKDSPQNGLTGESEIKKLRLQIVGRDTTRTRCISSEGILVEP